MTPAATILRMIESVAVEDTAGLDEIDCRAECYFQRKKFVAWPHKVFWPKTGETKEYRRMVTIDDEGASKLVASYYTRSRDALKAKRPVGWMFSMQSYLPSGDVKFLAISLKDSKLDRFTPFLPTEELAELHAIIQAIEFERNGGC